MNVFKHEYIYVYIRNAYVYIYIYRYDAIFCFLGVDSIVVPIAIAGIAFQA